MAATFCEDDISVVGEEPFGGLCAPEEVQVDRGLLCPFPTADLYNVLLCYLQSFDANHEAHKRAPIVRWTDEDVNEFYQRPIEVVRSRFGRDLKPVFLTEGTGAIHVVVDDEQNDWRIWIVAATYALLAYAQHRTLVVYVTDRSIGVPGTPATHWLLLCHQAGNRETTTTQRVLSDWHRYYISLLAE